MKVKFQSVTKAGPVKNQGLNIDSEWKKNMPHKMIMKIILQKVSLQKPTSEFLMQGVPALSFS